MLQRENYMAQTPETSVQMSPEAIGPVYNLDSLSEAGMARRSLLLSVTAGVAAVGAAIGSYIGLHGGESAHADTNPSSTTTIEAQAHGVDQGVLDALTVKTSTVDCAQIAETDGTGTDKVIKFSIGALKPVSANAAQANQETRLWSDAISTPYKSSEKDNVALLIETQKSVCGDPELGVTLANMFANMIVEGTEVVKLNPWLKPYAGNVDKINDEAKKFIPLLDSNITPNKDLYDKAIEQNHAYEKLAEKLDTLLSKFKADGVRTSRTTLFYHLETGGLVVGNLPEVELVDQLNLQYEAKAFRLKLDEKTGQCLIEIGFNIGDKRPEEFEECVIPTAPPVNNKLPQSTTPRRGTTPRTTPGTTTPTTTLTPKFDDGQGIPGPGGNSPQRTPAPEGLPTPDHDQPNPVGGTTPATPERPVTGTTVKAIGSGTTVQPTPNTQPDVPQG